MRPLKAMDLCELRDRLQDRLTALNIRISHVEKDPERNKKHLHNYRTERKAVVARLERLNPKGSTPC